MAKKKTVVPSIPDGIDLARQIWCRYEHLRDNGHSSFVASADKCIAYYLGDQWNADDVSKLDAAGRPHLTINKILSVVSNLQGSQVFNRTDTVFKPRNNGANEAVADALTKVFMQIGDNNNLTWTRSDVYTDGIIAGRGFFDARIDYDDNIHGEVRIRQLNPRNVLVDADASSYDPDRWNDVMYTEWWTLADIEAKYGPEKAQEIKGQCGGHYTSDDDAAIAADKFGTYHSASAPAAGADSSIHEMNLRKIRVLDYQYRRRELAQCFVDLATGDIRPVPTAWDDARVKEYVQANENVQVQEREISRIRWTVIAGDVVLYDDWSPYRHFTICGFFPHFIRGKTGGVVEHIIGPQELLNKSSSQELHVINTTANSGWITRRNNLVNMDVSELEERGAETGLVIEVETMDGLEKITPNATPTGLDRVSFKAEESIKTISGVSDYQTGFAREDVSAKAIKANQAGGSANTAHIHDNLNRTDYLLARLVLSQVQDFYTQERVVRITTDPYTNRQEEIVVNQHDEATGQILNDLTIGEYAVVVTNQPDRDNFEETQYDQILRLRTEAGVQIPDKYLIQASRLKDKADLLRDLEGDKDSPEAQAEAQRQAMLAARMQEAEVADKEADVLLKQAKAQEAMARTQANIAELQAGNDPDSAGMQAEMVKMQAEMLKLELEREKLAFEREKLAAEIEMKRYEVDTKVRADKYKADLTAQVSREQRATEERRIAEGKKAQDDEKSQADFAARASQYAGGGSENDSTTSKPAAKKPAAKKTTTKAPKAE